MSSELTPERIRQLRDADDCLPVSLVLHLDLPDEVAEDWMMNCRTTLVLDRELSLALAHLLDHHYGAAVGLNDEAARACGLMVNLGTDRQAFLASMLDALLQDRDPGDDPLTGTNERLTAARNRRYRRLYADPEELVPDAACHRGPYG